MVFAERPDVRVGRVVAGEDERGVVQDLTCRVARRCVPEWAECLWEQDDRSAAARVCPSERGKVARPGRSPLVGVGEAGDVDERIECTGGQGTVQCKRLREGARREKRGCSVLEADEGCEAAVHALAVRGKRLPQAKRAALLVSADRRVDGEPHVLQAASELGEDRVKHELRTLVAEASSVDLDVHTLL